MIPGANGTTAKDSGPPGEPGRPLSSLTPQRGAEVLGYGIANATTTSLCLPAPPPANTETYCFPFTE